MSRLRFALLDASHGDENTPRNFRRELPGDLIEYDVTDGELPRTGADHDAVVVTGSRSSVYWDDPWIESLTDRVARLVAADVPVLGVCYGHQVLADAVGGTVAAMEDYELGYREVHQVGDDPLFDGVPDPFLVFETHSDVVTDLPPGATLLAENDVGIQAFRHGSAWGLQFHPEYDLETARAVTKRKDLPEDRIAAVLEDCTPAAADRAAATKTVFANFADLVRGRRRERLAED
ncbi:MAG: type 1 glutamine amidotransferase [Halobacteriaceae archaeon]